ncbi:MAG: bifunctional 5,10-methylenetetrahydrofolate dehydrogenase/5,10-methenyltetrahydrofolate cyclohydrolase [Minisyncoccia bacterium]
MLKILDGKVVRNKIMADLKKKISDFNLSPNLAIIKIGDNPDSDIYVKMKIDFAKKIGAKAQVVSFSEKKVTQEMLLAEIEKLNNDKKVNGIIVQSPLPSPLNWAEAVEKVVPEKDVDGLCSANVKKLLDNDKTALIPATARGILSLLNYYKIPIKDKKVVVMGRSALVGKPVATLMTNNGAKVTVCHSQTIDPDKITREADILIVAIGKSELIGAEYVKSGQVVIDVGISTIINSDGTRKVHGDVDFDSVKNIVSAISPVPGGVGPMTVASLFENLVQQTKIN